MTDYNNFAKTFSQSRKNMQWGELDFIIDDILKNNFSKILDIWCGSGRFLEFFTKKSDKNIVYFGVDASENMILEAKNNYPNHYFYTQKMQNITSEFLNFQKFDAIIFLASFHHLNSENERIKVIKNSLKNLEPNGKIYLTNWNLLAQEKYQNSHQGNGDFDIKIWWFSRYYHGFSLNELEEIFLKSNAKILQHSIFDGWRNFLSILQKP